MFLRLINIASKVLPYLGVMFITFEEIAIWEIKKKIVIQNASEIF